MNNSFKRKITEYRTFVVLIIILIIASILSSDFFSVSNIFNVLRQITIIAILGAGMTFIILTGGIDLSVGSILAISGMFSAVVLDKTNLVFLSILVGVLVGTICGYVNGLIITKGEIPPFIATLATMTLLRGIVLVYTNGSPIGIKSASYTFLGKGSIIGIPVPIIILIIVYIIAHIILNHTSFGREVYAIGGNKEAARLSGINVKKTELYVYVIGGLLAGLTGVILTSRLGSAQPTAGTGFELDAIAAVIIGGTSLSGGQGFVLPTVVGAMILGILDNILVLLNVNSFAANIVKGIVILIAVLADKRFEKISLKIKEKEE